MSGTRSGYVGGYGDGEGGYGVGGGREVAEYVSLCGGGGDVGGMQWYGNDHDIVVGGGGGAGGIGVVGDHGELDWLSGVESTTAGLDLSTVDFQEFLAPHPPSGLSSGPASTLQDSPDGLSVVDLDGFGLIPGSESQVMAAGSEQSRFGPGGVGVAGIHGDGDGLFFESLDAIGTHQSSTPEFSVDNNTGHLLYNMPENAWPQTSVCPPQTRGEKQTSSHTDSVKGYSPPGSPPKPAAALKNSRKNKVTKNTSRRASDNNNSAASANGPADPAADKRWRNTLAARRCRQRQVDRIEQLERALDEMSKERDDLKVQVAKWEGEATALRGMLNRAGR